MKQHKCHKEIKLNDTQGHILSFTIIFGSLISAVYFFGGWGVLTIMLKIMKLNHNLKSHDICMYI